MGPGGTSLKHVAQNRSKKQYLDHGKLVKVKKIYIGLIQREACISFDGFSYGRKTLFVASGH